MTTDVAQLYQTVIVDHSKRPRNFRAPADGARVARGYNPLCGDALTVSAMLAGCVVHDVAFQGSACAVATASASLMTEAVKGLPLADVARLCGAFEALVTTGSASEDLGALVVFAAVVSFPSRVKCALLPWHALAQTLAQGSERTGCYGNE